ncbi:MAG TPA: hypothetical protein VFE15_14845, partial [Marmoricola sp.]|nr:hypothetical protein [Marmoricola sp.]
MEIAPALNLTSFNCPHCKALSQQDWARCYAVQNGDTEFDPDLRVSTCFACKQETVWRYEVKSAPRQMGNVINTWESG